MAVARLKRRISLLRAAPLPAAGYKPALVPTPLLDSLSDGDLAQINQILPWQCFTVDSRGRRLGDRAWAGKREDPQPIPDRRIELLDKKFGLQRCSVLEIGCFEGVHTIALAARAARVVAIDSRVENVVKTIVRSQLYGHSPEVRICNVESQEALSAIGTVDVVHHVGVLYHLLDPVAHLRALGPLVGRALMLDTHVARPAEAKQSYESGGRQYRFRSLAEGGKAEVFSGMYDHAKWLVLEDLVGLLQELGFTNVDVEETREERNGLRILLFASRSPSPRPTPNPVVLDPQ